MASCGNRCMVKYPGCVVSLRTPPPRREPLEDTKHQLTDLPEAATRRCAMRARKARSDCVALMAGRVEGTNRVAMWRARFTGVWLRVTRPKPIPTSPHARRLRSKLLPLVAIQSTILFVPPSVIPDPTVFTVQSILLLCTVCESAATCTATSPTTSIAVTKRDFIATHLIATHTGTEPRIPQAILLRFSTCDIPMHPQLSHTPNPFCLSHLRPTLSTHCKRIYILFLPSLEARSATPMIALARAQHSHSNFT
jgi:hypothetical protein